MIDYEEFFRFRLPPINLYNMRQLDAKPAVTPPPRPETHKKDLKNMYTLCKKLL